MSKCNINFEEYSCSIISVAGCNVLKSSYNNSSTKKISEIEISLLTAKGILTKTASIKSAIIAVARSYFEIVPFLFAEKDGFWTLDDDYYDLLRDFSRSTKTGEFAQGFNYFLALYVLNAKCVYDYHYFCETNGFPVTRKEKTPDYVLVYKNGDIGLLESKGTLYNNPTSSLIDGYKQCESGEKHFISHHQPLANSFVSTVRFRRKSNKKDAFTTVYYVDPKLDENIKQSISSRDYMYEYSKAFYLAGDLENTKRLMQGKPLLKLDSKKEINEGFIIGEWVINSLQNKKRVLVGIKKEAIEYLNSIQGEPPVFLPVTPDDNNYELFDDGIFIIIE